MNVVLMAKNAKPCCVLEAFIRYFIRTGKEGSRNARPEFAKNNVPVIKEKIC